ncbi:MAG: hypothetical protein WA010_09340, partial [Sulfuricurvum sp.]
MRYKGRIWLIVLVFIVNLINVFGTITEVGHCNPDTYVQGQIKTAVDNASSGDTISICDGTYDERILITSKSNLIIESKSQDQTSVTFQNTSGNPTIKFEGNSQNITIKNFKIIENNAPNAIRADDGSPASVTSGLRLENLYIKFNHSGDAINLINTSGVILSGLTVWAQETNSNGITLKDGCDNFQLLDSNITSAGDNNNPYGFKATDAGTFVMSGNTISSATSSGVILQKAVGAFTVSDNNVTVVPTNATNVVGITIEGEGASAETGGNNADISGNIIKVSGGVVQSALSLINIYNTMPTDNCFLGGYGTNTIPHEPLGECTSNTNNNLTFFGNFWGNSGSVRVNPDCPDSLTRSSCNAVQAGQTEPFVYAGFNIVYADYANNALPSQYYYNLPTQIASRADNYKVISQV